MIRIGFCDSPNQGANFCQNLETFPRKAWQKFVPWYLLFHMAQNNSSDEQQLSGEELTELMRRILGRNPNDPIRVDPSSETPIQRSKRVRHYLESGATAYCKQCDQTLLLCECTGLPHGERVNFAWPSSYSRKVFV